jgi:putative Mg2+ transporter-C (MgtC) family protein
MDALDEWDILLRMSAAVLGGGVLGWERQVNDKSAGLRTHMMVSLGAATILVTGMQLVAALPSGDGRLRVDPVRLIEAVVGGVGFLGAGAIIQSRGGVRGLTTASSVWLSAAVGMACGLGYFVIAASSTVIGLVILLLLRVLESRTGLDAGKASRPDSDD